MKVVVFLLSVVACEAALRKTLKQQVKLHQMKLKNNYGNKDCQCVGIDELEGATIATLKDGSKPEYPADLGARCSAWDQNKHPKCEGDDAPDWCSQKWCYVDPCKCDISVLPKPSIYLPDAKYQGKPVHFSYATCGGSDSYTAKEHAKTKKDIEETCSVNVNAKKWGAEECRCVGVGPQPGTTKVNVKDKMVAFPADTGATCEKWEEDNHPDCQVDDPPDWCSQAWCYVDPCSCKLEISPKTSSYLPDSYYQGKPVYFSYATCGGIDAFTAAEHKTACVNQKTSDACAGLDKCAWTGKECLGKELVSVCNLDAKADDDDEGDDDDEEEEEEPKVNPEQARLQKELADNVAKQSDLKTKLKFLTDESRSDQEIDAYAKLVKNETQSPAMASMLGKMWKEMRMFEVPSYTEHVEDKLHQLRRKERAVEEKLATVQTAEAVKKDHNYGNNKCQCVGIDEVEGTTVATLADKSKVNYPADLGARCEAWDLNEHPKCPGESWCEQKWCYVDPCECDISTLPKPSTYLVGAKYQGKPVHFSYATCDGKDTYSGSEDSSIQEKTAKDIEKTCSVNVNPAKWGAEECRCVGIGPQPGKVKVAIKDKQVDFPADTGATCNKWEEDNHPDCQGDDAPDWCTQAWCYVDPCECKLAVSPKTSSYLPDSNYQGKPIYYSYATCGGTDAYTASEHKKACINQKTSKACKASKKCAWDGKQCLGKELVEVCAPEEKAGEGKSAAFNLKAIMAFVLPTLMAFV